MGNKHLWREARRINKSLPRTESWVEKLTIEDIAKILFPNNDNYKNDLLIEMNCCAENGNIEFNDIQITAPNKHIDMSGIGSSDQEQRDREMYQQFSDCSLVSEHDQACWRTALKGVVQGGSIKLEYRNGCNCDCTLMKTYHNGLPKHWLVEGIHESCGIKFTVRLLFETTPLMTAKQCHDFLNSEAYLYFLKSIKIVNPLATPNYSILSGWWEGLDLCTKDALDKKLSIYEQRKISFTTWLNASSKKLDDFDTVEAIFTEVKKTDDKTEKGKLLWSQYSSFKRDFWQEYCKEIGYKRKNRNDCGHLLGNL